MWWWREHLAGGGDTSVLSIKLLSRQFHSHWLVGAAPEQTLAVVGAASLKAEVLRFWSLQSRFCFDQRKTEKLS